MSERKHIIKTYNNIAQAGLDVFAEAGYQVGPDTKKADAIMLRSANLHEEKIDESVLAIGRAGAGVNNVPVDDMTSRGVAVFNAPGANANAVKELVIAGLILAYRNVADAAEFTKTVTGEGEEFKKAVEAAKKQFAGEELRGKTLGVIGLGAIGVEVANAAARLGMRVVGYDPHLSVHNAWKLSPTVEKTEHLNEVFVEADAITVHVPLIPATKGIVGAAAIERLKRDAVILNFARDGIVDDDAVQRALADGKIARYVTDFPTPELIKDAHVITLPHLGASTAEAETASSVMAANELKEYLEDGNLTNSVNMPNVELPRAGKTRLAIIHKNQPDMLGQITHILGEHDVNIVHIVNECRGDIAYTLLDAEDTVEEKVTDAICKMDGVIRVRVL